MSLRRWLRVALAIIMLGALAVAIKQPAPEKVRSGRLDVQMPSLFGRASACAETRWNPRRVLALVGDHILQHLFHGTAFAGLAGSEAERVRARAIGARRCSVGHLGLVYHMRVVSAVIAGGTGLAVRVAGAPGEFVGYSRLSPWAGRFFGVVAREMVAPGAVLLVTGRNAGRAGVVARAVAGAAPGRVYYRGDEGARAAISIVSLPSRAALQGVVARQDRADRLAVPVMRVSARRAVPASGYGFGGTPVGLGTPIDLGGGGGWSLAGLIGRADAARAVVVPACVAGAAPAVASGAVPARVAALALPIRKFLPQFYGAPWTARVGDDLVAVLDDYAPRDRGVPVPPPAVRVYRGWFAGNRGAAAYAGDAAAHIVRGSTALLYRVYAQGPIDCIDIVDRHGSSMASGTIYYRRGSRLYEVSTMFRINR